MLSASDLLPQALSRAERDLQLARRDVQTLRQERSAAGQAQERLLAAEKELERLKGAEAQLDQAEKVLMSLLSSQELAEDLAAKICTAHYIAVGSDCLGLLFWARSFTLELIHMYLERNVTEQEGRELRLEASGARRREASLKDAHAARITQLEREIQKLKPAALHAKDLEARLADREQRVQKLRAEVASPRLIA